MNLQQCKHEYTIGDNCVNCSVNNVSNLQQFLEEEQKDVKNNGHKVFISEITTMEWLKDHDTRLINKVLDEVKREVEKKAGEGTLVSINDISTIIDNLKLK